MVILLLPHPEAAGLTAAGRAAFRGSHTSPVSRVRMRKSARLRMGEHLSADLQHNVRGVYGEEGI